MRILVRWKSIIQFLLVLLTIMMSKTVYFGVVNESIWRWIYYAAIILCFLILKMKVKDVNNILLKIMPFMVLFGLNLIVYSSEMSSQTRNGVLGWVVNFVLAAAVVSMVPKSKFSHYYIEIIFWISLISLICWSTVQIELHIGDSFAKVESLTGYQYLASPFYTWGRLGYAFKKNPGPFWEPGAFQAFVFLAIFMLLYDTENNEVIESKNKYHRSGLKKSIYFGVYILTVITTQSTTAYILLLVLALTQSHKISGLLKRIPIGVRVLVIFALGAGLLVFVLQSGNIAEKLQGVSNDSASIRKNDFFGGIALCFQEPFLGLGATANKSQLMLLFNVNKDDSSGFTQLGYSYGIPVLILYMVNMYRGIRQFFKMDRFIDEIILYAVCLVLHCTQNFWALPVFLYFIFYRTEESKTVNNRPIQVRTGD